MRGINVKKWGWVVAAITLTLVAYFPVSFVYSEWTRKKLLDSYQASPTFLNSFRNGNLQSVGEILRPGEILVCAIDAYGTTESLPSLNSSQRRSLKKDKLPSEDMTWYLIFYSQNKAERVVLMERYGDSGIRLIESGCYDRTVRFSVSQVESKGEVKELAVNFFKEEAK